jgi:hypothetical protein
MKRCFPGEKLCEGCADQSDSMNPGSELISVVGTCWNIMYKAGQRKGKGRSVAGEVGSDQNIVKPFCAKLRSLHFIL